MLSKGFYTRTLKHPILQDGRIVILKLKQKKWKYKNPNFGYFKKEEFTFILKKRLANYTDLIIVVEFRDFNPSAQQIAKKFNVSDTYVLNTFEKYVYLDRLSLPESLAIDEVYLNMDKEHKYALILQDFSS